MNWQTDRAMTPRQFKLTIARLRMTQAAAARYLGVANIATAGGSAIARFLGGALIDSLNRATGTLNVGYLTVFGLALAFFIASAIVILPLPVPGAKGKTL